MTIKSCALLLAMAACLAGPAAAQVVRCTDPATGKTTYTDGECRRGEAAREVEGRKTAEEREQEREQAAEALARKHERQQHEALLRPPPAAPAPRTAAAPDPASSAACLQARQHLQQELAASGRGMYDEQQRLDAARRQADLACLTPAEFARADSERSRAQAAAPAYYPSPVVIVPARPHRPPPVHPPVAPPREITQCNVFRCYDRQGNIYPR
ncbi:DUF4124 domain-containing protein [Pulveribacter suum]|uniref:DUF4124 domain-containing protein n=1 Tax=Pulveribacter suum TaxID=2116657 RepID=A0A2P1NJX7_9BURK|nr:DUF4124 domain-containing protein [Pulveribacter suum]AVP57355.1 DUF4124 domain-containing protein [Pulveribacter suum]